MFHLLSWLHEGDFTAYYLFGSPLVVTLATTTLPSRLLPFSLNYFILEFLMSNPIYYIRFELCLCAGDIYTYRVNSSIFWSRRQIIFMTSVFIYCLLSRFDFLTTYSSSWVKWCSTVDADILDVRVAYHESTKQRNTDAFFFFFPYSEYDHGSSEHSPESK